MHTHIHTYPKKMFSYNIGSHFINHSVKEMKPLRKNPDCSVSVFKKMERKHKHSQHLANFTSHFMNQMQPRANETKFTLNSKLFE